MLSYFHIYWRVTINFEIVVLNCQRCKECLNVHRSFGLLFETVLQMSLALSLSLSLSFCWSGHVSSSLWSYGSRGTRNSFPVFTAPNLSMQISQTQVINPQSLWALLLLPEDLEVTDSKVSVVSLTEDLCWGLIFFVQWIELIIGLIVAFLIKSYILNCIFNGIPFLIDSRE